jgi:hypothetical protein
LYWECYILLYTKDSQTQCKQIHTNAEPATSRAIGEYSDHWAKSSSNQIKIDLAYYIYNVFGTYHMSKAEIKYSEKEFYFCMKKFSDR